MELEKKKTCFIIMPITTPEQFIAGYGGDTDHFRHVLDHLFIPAVEQAGMEAIPPSVDGSDMITPQIIRTLESADLVLCDWSSLNANVFFELGIRTALNKPACIVIDEQSTIPFDPSGLHAHRYSSKLDPWIIKEEIQKLVPHIKGSFTKSEGVNRLWKYFGIATQASPEQEQLTEKEGWKFVTREMIGLKEQLADLQRNVSTAPSPKSLDLERALRVARQIREQNSETSRTPPVDLRRNLFLGSASRILSEEGVQAELVTEEAPRTVTVLTNGQMPLRVMTILIDTADKHGVTLNFSKMDAPS